MKKSKITFIIVAISLILVGGVGMLISYPKVEKGQMTDIHESISNKQSKQKTVEVLLDENYSYSFEPSKDDQIHVDGSYKSFYKGDNLHVETDEKSDRIILSVRSTKYKQRFQMMPFLDEDRSNIVIQLPKSIENMILEPSSGELNVENLALQRLHIKEGSDSIMLKDIKTSELLIDESYDDTMLDNVSADEKMVLTVGTNTSLSNVKTPRLSINASYADIELRNITGQTTINTEAGDINLENIHGKVAATTENGDINFTNSKLTKDATLSAYAGDISVDFDTLSEDIRVKTKTESGDVSIFDKNRLTYGTKSNGPLLTCHTDYGDIDIQDNNSSIEDDD